MELFLSYSYIVISFLLSVVCISKEKKISKRIMIILAITYSYFLIFVYSNFNIKLFNTSKYIFVDELVYINGLESFGKYVRFLNNLNMIELQRGINLFFYLFSIGFFLNHCQSKLKSKSIVLIALCTSIYSYWCFFILKEALSCSMLILVIYFYERRKVIPLFLSVCILYFVRDIFGVICLCFILLNYIYSKSKKVFNVILIIITVLVLINFNNEPIRTFKLAAISRRFGENNKIFDAATYQALKLPFYKFFISEVYIQTLKRNINDLINFTQGGFYIKVLRGLNFYFLIMFIKEFKKIKKIKVFNLFWMLFFVNLLGHSGFRYLNTLSLPFYLRMITTKSKE